MSATTQAARRARELALTVLEGRLDHGRLLAFELRDAAAGRGGRLAARHAASRLHLRQLDRFLTVTSRTALTDAVNALRRRAGEPPVRRVDL